MAIKKANSQGDPVAALNAVNRWIEADWQDPGIATIQAFLYQHPSVSLKAEMDEMQWAALNHSPSWAGEKLLSKLASLRAKGKRLVQTSEIRCLPELNPPVKGSS